MRYPSDQVVRLASDAKGSVLEALRSQGIKLASPCGGAGTCGKCKVTVRRAEVIEETELACQESTASVKDVLVPEDAFLGEGRAMDVVLGGTSAANPWKADHGEGFGLALDVGTTTIACHLYDLKTGTVIESGGRANPQGSFGADVISRITAAEAGHGAELQRVVNEAIAALACRLIERAGIKASGIVRAVVAGNTVMEHLAAGVDPAPIGRAPFTAPTLFGCMQPLQALGYLGCSTREAFFAPCVAGYVGGDITADVLSLGMASSSDLRLLADLGTNGEMALGTPDGIICCATAAGPVFEGANITFGMPAYPGAVARVRWEAEGLVVETVNDEPAQGICGSGLIDVLALLLDVGIIEEGGLMLEADELDATVPSTIAERVGTHEGAPAFWVTPQIAVTQRDVRNVQLAKAAICAGMLTLLESAQIEPAQVVRLDIAGGLGQHLSLRNAARIGLFPRVLSGVARSVGNAAIEGAGLALMSDAAREELGRIARGARYLELSTSSTFNERYLEAMEFLDQA